MKALVKKEAAPGIWMDDIPEPKIGPNDVLIEIAKTAICGTDMHIYNWDAWAQKTIHVPMAVGHEYCGRIVDIGSEVRGFALGDRVSGEGHITCGHCRNCRAGRRHLCRNTVGVGVDRQGAFAEYLSLPAVNAFKLTDAITDDVASFLDAFGNATHTSLAFNMVGEDVLITGAGPIGIMAVAICRFVGARHVVITDVNDYRLDLARKMGASRAINVQRETLDDTMQALGMQEGFDVGLEMSGNAVALRDLLRTMHHGGSVALLGIPPGDTAIDWNQVIFKGLTLQGIYGRQMFETWYKMSALLQSGLNIGPVITHHYPVQEFKSGFCDDGLGALRQSDSRLVDALAPAALWPGSGTPRGEDIRAERSQARIRRETQIRQTEEILDRTQQRVVIVGDAGDGAGCDPRREQHGTDSPASRAQQPRRQALTGERVRPAAGARSATPFTA